MKMCVFNTGRLDYSDKSMSISIKENREKEDLEDANAGEIECTRYASVCDRQVD
jgi:hypothetical protein